MSANAETRRVIFERVNSGDIEGGRSLFIMTADDFETDETKSLAATSHGDEFLETLCLMAREFGLPPTNVKYAVGCIGEAKRYFPNSSAYVALAFGYDSDAWLRPDQANQYIEHERGEPAQGPFEAAERLFAHVACCNWRVTKNHAKPNYRPTQVMNDATLIGAAQMRGRDAEAALAKFRDGYGRAADIANKRREFLGSHYKPSSDGGAGDIRASCLAGEVLALRELGRFREMGDALRRLRAEPA
ncbi:MAG: hypothetical protein ABL879_19000, partial [Devosia sp.]